MPEITLVGYGNQGKAWAANLRDSGWNVTVSGRPNGRGIAQAASSGYATIPASALRAVRGPIALLLPDETIRPFFSEFLEGGAPGRQFLFAHGFAVTFTRPAFSPADDVILVAPKGIGPKLRENFVNGSGVMGAVAVDQDSSGKARETARAVAEGLGLTRVGLVDTTFAGETKCDLLSEQVVLCGVVPRLVRETTEFLVRHGIDRRLAAYECLNELKLIVDMMVEHGVDGMYERISTAARFGGLRAADVILSRDELREKTEALWEKIEGGGFARDLLGQLEAKEQRAPAARPEAEPGA
jgi:ketol-acid reductoisomerase